MRIIADFHLHSKYSRATSSDMNLETIARWCELKGINLVGTGDFTHPTYFLELQAELEPTAKGLFKLKNKKSEVHFILTVEVSNIYSQKGKLRKIHTILFAPTFESVQKINSKLGRLGKLASDGRPTFGFTAKDLVKLVTEVSPECFIVPAHAWTPWFSIFGANSGFDSIQECFEEQSKYIYCIETGLSSDPSMNWRLSTLDNIALISNSDAHSPSKLGREANVFNCEMDYYEIIEAIKQQDSQKFLYTLEFFPEEGKYHYDGHRNCGILFAPSDSKKHKNICPVCGKKLTVGVMQRVDDLADRPEGFKPQGKIPFKNLIPLPEIIAEALGQNPETKGVENEYSRLVKTLGPEFRILLDLSLEEIGNIASPKIVEGIKKVREGKVNIVPGYDGVYGKISLFEEISQPASVEKPPQLGLFDS